MPHFAKLLGTAAIVLSIGGAAFADGTSTAPAATGAAKPADATAATPKKDVNADTVVATVNGTDITIGQMITVHDSLPAQYQSLPDDVLFKGILDQLVQQTALAKIGEGMKTKRNDIALDVDRTSYLAGIVLDKVAADAASDDAVKKAYDEKYAHMAPETEYHAAHILVKTEAEAKKIKAEIDGGKDFAAEAKANSKDGAAANGGDLGWFTLDKMVKPFGDALAKMKPGEVAGPIQTEYGWHVVKLIGERPAKAPELAEVQDELADGLRQQAVQDKVTATVDAAKVEKMTDGIDPAVLKNDDLLGK